MRKANRLGAFITVMRRDPGLLPLYAVACLAFCALAWWAGSDLVITYNSVGYPASAVISRVALYLGVLLGALAMAYASMYAFNITVTRELNRQRRLRHPSQRHLRLVRN